MMPLVYIILVNYRGLSDTIECVNSLQCITYDNYRIVIVDNASKDNSYEVLKKEFTNHAVIESAENLGFSGGNNIGIRYALQNSADYVLLLNNDTVVEPDFLSKLVGCAEASKGSNKNIGIVGGKILLYDNRSIISHAGGYIDMFRYTTVHYGVNGNYEEEQFNLQKKVGFISGCMMLIDVNVFDKIGLLNEKYFMYYEDTDFCQAATDNGFELIYCPEAQIYHKVSNSSGGEDSPFFLRWNTRNRLIFMSKYRHKSNSLRYVVSLCYVYGTRLLRRFIYLSKGDTEKAYAIKTGMREGRVLVKEERRSNK